MLRSLLLVAFLTLSSSAALGELLNPDKYDRSPRDGILSRDEAVIWLMHSNDIILAKYDTNFNGMLDGTEAGGAIQKDSIESFEKRKQAIANEVLYYGNRTVAQLRTLLAGIQPPKADPCKNIQNVFIRRDRLDTFQYRDASFIVGAVARKDAKGANFSYTRDELTDLSTFAVNGRLSAVVIRQHLSSPCPEISGIPKDADAFQLIPDPQQPTVFSYLVAPWVDAQGSFNDPRKKTEQSSLQGGFDAQVGIAGGPIFDFQYFIASPYALTDLRGEARGWGFRLGWEPFLRDANLGGRIGVPNPFIDWYWQFRAEADVRHVDAIGVTNLQLGTAVWLGGTVRFYATLFPDRSKLIPSEVPLFEELTRRLYGAATYQHFWDAQSSRDVSKFIGEVGLNLSSDGTASVSFGYHHGTDKDTLVNMRKYIAGLNIKF